MKNQFMFPVFAIILIAFLSSCNNEDVDQVADPEGTITITLNGHPSLIIYQGIDAEPLYPQAPQWVYLFFHFGMDTNTLNAVSTINISPNPNENQVDQLYNTIDVANVGSVSGLGYVTTKPTTGYSPQSALQKGHGYVIRYRKTHDQSNINYPYFYARFYVVDWLKSTTGGIIGVTINYQNPF